MERCERRFLRDELRTALGVVASLLADAFVLTLPVDADSPRRDSGSAGLAQPLLEAEAD